MKTAEQKAAAAAALKEKMHAIRTGRPIIRLTPAEPPSLHSAHSRQQRPRPRRKLRQQAAANGRGARRIGGTVRSVFIGPFRGTAA